MRTPTNKLTIVAFITFVFAPFALAISGVSGGISETENRTAAKFPTVWTAPLTAGTWQAVDRWVEDRIPFRTDAIAAERELRLRFDDRRSQLIEQTDNVIAGVDPRWLFYVPATAQPCVSPEQEALWVAEIRRVEDLLNSLDRQLIIGLAPDRGVVIPERLGDADNACQRANMEVIERLSELDAVENLGESVNNENDVLRTDTHWSPTGAFAAAEQLVDAIDPGAWRPTGVRSEELEVLGDLAKFVGLSETETTQIIRFNEDTSSTVVVREGGLGSAVTPNASPLSVLLAHDSYGGSSAIQSGSSASYIRPWFAEFDNLRLPGDTAEPLALEPVRSSLIGADVVGFLFVQRTLGTRFSTTHLYGPIVLALQDELLLTPLEVVAQPAGASIQTPGTAVLLDFDDFPSSDVEISATSGEIEGRFDLEMQTVIVVAPGTTLALDREPAKASALTEEQNA